MSKKSTKAKREERDRDIYDRALSRVRDLGQTVARATVAVPFTGLNLAEWCYPGELLEASRKLFGLTPDLYYHTETIVLETGVRIGIGWRSLKMVPLKGAGAIWAGPTKSVVDVVDKVTRIYEQRSNAITVLTYLKENMPLVNALWYFPCIAALTKVPFERGRPWDGSITDILARMRDAQTWVASALIAPANEVAERDAYFMVYPRNGGGAFFFKDAA